VLKKGDPLLPGNYRPISLLSVFDKLLEKLMHCRLYKHLQLNNILYKFQFGFKPLRSTSLALIDVIDNLYENLDACSKVCGIYLDLQKAFDSVSHDSLFYLKKCIFMVFEELFDTLTHVSVMPLCHCLLCKC
jgi:hypothetical protein